MELPNCFQEQGRPASPAEKPSCLKRARDSDEELPSLKKRAVAFCSSVNDKERVAGVALYQQRGHLMRQAEDKNKTVSIESYLKQKHLVDGLQKHIARMYSVVHNSIPQLNLSHLFDRRKESINHLIRPSLGALCSPL